MAQGKTAAETAELRELLSGRPYRLLLVVSALVGVPVSLVAFGFLSLEHWLQHGVWQWLPHELGLSGAPWWWPLPALLLCGALVGLCAGRLPGRGGHVPAHGLGLTPTPPLHLPGIALAALVSLPLGAVLGPEAPLMALGSGLALLGVDRAGALPAQARSVLGAAGAASAISVIFGNPLVAAVLLIEAAGVGGPQLVALLLPCLLASGVGALVFTGFDRWSGFGTGTLTLPNVPPDQTPAVGDFLWGVPLAVLIAVAAVPSMRLAGRLAVLAERRTLLVTVASATAAGGCAAVYALATGRSCTEAVLSGQATLAQLAATPHAWSFGALLALVVLKGVAWMLSMGSLRGGPIFPTLFLGSAAAMLLVDAPGFGPAPALAAGLAAGGAAVLRLPLSSILLAALLLGRDSVNELPLVIVSATVAFLVGESLRAAPEQPAAAPPGPAAPAAPAAPGSAG